MKLRVNARHDRDDLTYTLSVEEIANIGVDVKALYVAGVFRFEMLNGWTYHVTLVDEPTNKR